MKAILRSSLIALMLLGGYAGFAASSATQQQGREAAIFKAVFGHSVALVSLVGLIVMFYAYVVPWWVP